MGAIVSLLFTLLWTPAYGILGAGRAMMLGHGFSLFCTAVHLAGRVFHHSEQNNR